MAGVSKITKAAMFLRCAHHAKDCVCAGSSRVRPYNIMNAATNRRPTTQAKTARCRSFVSRVSGSRELIATVTRCAT
jgi:hypothetical protein